MDWGNILPTYLLFYSEWLSIQGIFLADPYFKYFQFHNIGNDLSWNNSADLLQGSEEYSDRYENSLFVTGRPIHISIQWKKHSTLLQKFIYYRLCSQTMKCCTFWNVLLLTLNFSLRLFLVPQYWKRYFMKQFGRPVLGSEYHSNGYKSSLIPTGCQQWSYRFRKENIQHWCKNSLTGNFVVKQFERWDYQAIKPSSRVHWNGIRIQLAIRMVTMESDVSETIVRGSWEIFLLSQF